MADTARTLAALQTLLADNTSGAISPQDVRDFMVSTMGGYGSIHVVGGSTAQTAIGGTPVQVTGFVADSATSSQCTPAHATDDITFDVAGVWLSAWAISFSGTNNVTFTGQIQVTGTGTVNGGSWQRKLSAAGDVGDAFALAVISGAVATDTLECMISGDGASDSMTPTNMQLMTFRIS